MAEEENNEQEAPAEETADVEVEETPEAAAEETTEAEAEAPEAPAEEPAPTPAAAAPAAPAEPGEPVEQLSPKERRSRRRSTHTGEPNPPMSNEERIAARGEERKRKATSRSRYRKGRGAARHVAGTGSEPAVHEPGRKRVQQGTVVSSKGNKTITVAVQSARRHPAYEKIIRRSKKIHAHDERNEAGEGDTVRVIETRPMSKTKHWRLVEILERAK